MTSYIELNEIIDCLNKTLKRNAIIRLRCCSKRLNNALTIKDYTSKMKQLNTSDLTILKMVVLTPTQRNEIDFYKFIHVMRYLKSFRKISTSFQKNHYNYLITFCIYKYIVMEYSRSNNSQYLSTYGYDLPTQLIYEIMELHLETPYQFTIEAVYSIVNRYDFDDSIQYLMYC